MKSIGIGEMQKNIAILSHLTEVIEIVDRRRRKSVAMIYPLEAEGVVDRLAGKYRERVEPVEDLAEAREEAMRLAMEEKYGLSDRH